jgi:hypothetical protein
MWVEVLFMMVILKIPVVYLCLVVWWAVRAVPQPLEGAAAPARLPKPDEPCSWRRPRRPGPRGGLTRRTAVAHRTRAAAR